MHTIERLATFQSHVKAIIVNADMGILVIVFEYLCEAVEIGFFRISQCQTGAYRPASAFSLLPGKASYALFPSASVSHGCFCHFGIGQ